jgi:hypothetical protein
LLHRIWQTKGKLPHEILALNKGEQAFLFASELVAAENKENFYCPLLKK